MFFSLEPHLPWDFCTRGGQYECVCCGQRILMQRGRRFPPPDHHSHRDLGYAEIRWVKAAPTRVHNAAHKSRPLFAAEEGIQPAHVSKLGSGKVRAGADEPEPGSTPARMIDSGTGDSARILLAMVDEFYQRIPRPRAGARLQRPKRGLF
jgi:hypothetical protein